MQATKGNNILALDVGQARVGVAIAGNLARLPRPLATLNADEKLLDSIAGLVESEDVSEVVVGLPRNLSGHDTEQTRRTRDFAQQLKTRLSVPVKLQDEALTSKKAQAELRDYKRVRPEITLDSLAAVYILEDYLAGHKSGGLV